mmetsp:Transcript_40000/g.66353  ORF Transcript_40000/g.66353 Transcript_40000/m.66353 type:complete len:238 (+) Transcript_40000:162-875(+)
MMTFLTAAAPPPLEPMLLHPSKSSAVAANASCTDISLCVGMADRRVATASIISGRLPAHWNAAVCTSRRLSSISRRILYSSCRAALIPSRVESCADVICAACSSGSPRHCTIGGFMDDTSSETRVAAGAVCNVYFSAASLSCSRVLSIGCDGGGTGTRRVAHKPDKSPRSLAEELPVLCSTDAECGVTDEPGSWSSSRRSACTSAVSSPRSASRPGGSCSSESTSRPNDAGTSQPFV